MINIGHKNKLLKDAMTAVANRMIEPDKIKIINCIRLLREQFFILEQAISDEDSEDIELVINAIVTVIDGRLEN
jgi:hypothetical protein